MSWPFSSFLSLRSNPLESFFPTRNPSAPDAGSSPRKPGSLLVDITRLIAALQPACEFFPARNPSAPDAGSSPRKPGSLLTN